MPARAVALLAAAATAAGASAPAVAAADVRRDVCVASVALRDSPGGFAIGHLKRPESVRVLDRTAGRRWSRIRTRTRLTGWVPSRVLC